MRISMLISSLKGRGEPPEEESEDGGEEKESEDS